MLAFTGSYPRPLFDLVLGLNRWFVRAAAYATLTTDAYPPLRLDLGDEPPGARDGGARAPHLGAIGAGLLSGGAALAVLSAGLLVAGAGSGFLTLSRHDRRRRGPHRR